ncbi:MAG: hypothetical protein IKW95_07240 [Lachnospiraceae bacterium]|nr:hypothetical protein [Lachnospiraceae bacterium]
MRKLRTVTALVLVFAALFCIGGCRKRALTDKQYEELAQKQAERNKKNVLLRVTVAGQTHEITEYDLVYVLALNEHSALQYKNEQNDYFVSMYGENYDFWGLKDSNGTTVRDGYKEDAFKTAVYAYSLYYEAKAAGLELDEAHRKNLASATQNFMNNFTPAERAKCGMTEECIRSNYEVVFLADQYETILKQTFTIDEEAIRKTVNKEDYRTYRTRYLSIAKYDRDESYKKVEFSPEEQERRKNAIMDAYKRTKNGESMESVYESYKDIMYGGISEFTALNIDSDPDYNQAAMKLKKGETTLFERDASYYVITLEDNTQYQGYEEAVAAAIETATNTGLSGLFDNINSKYDFARTEAWDSIKYGEYAIVTK